MPITEGRFRGFIDQDERNDLHPSKNGSLLWAASCVFNEVYNEATGKWQHLGADQFRQFVRVVIQKNDGQPNINGYDQLGKLFNVTGPAIDEIMCHPEKWPSTGIQTTFTRKPSNNGDGKLFWENGFVNAHDYESGPAVLDAQTKSKTKGIVAKLREQIEAREKAKANPQSIPGFGSMPPSNPNGATDDDLPF